VERALWAAVDAAGHRLEPDGYDDVDAVVDALRDLAPAIDAFFDGVLVMADDPALRAARLTVLHTIAALPDAVADLSKLEGF